MASIKINVDHLILALKLLKGQDIITKSTANPNAPGNTAVLAAFSTEQTDLETAVANALGARQASKEATAIQKAVLRRWMEKLKLLASFTETATGGDAAKILSTGFDVRATPTPPPSLGMVMGLTVRIDGTPGHSKLDWDTMAGADGFLVQGSPDPITPTSWSAPVFVTKTKYTANGAIAGQKHWYRVAAINGDEQGPWSEPASRPVM